MSSEEAGTPDGQALIAALRAARHGLDPRPVVAAADALVKAPLPATAAERALSGLAEPTRAELIADALVHMAIEDGAVPGSPGDPHLILRRWALDEGLCSDADLVRMWEAVALRWGRAQGWLPPAVYDDVIVGLSPLMRAMVGDIARGNPEGDKDDA